MKRSLALILLLAGGAHAEEALPPREEAASAAAAPTASNAEAVESRFQGARKAYLAGDRDAALREVSEALRLDPYHSGSTKLYETIRAEEKGLRQVRLAAPEAAPKPAAQGETGAVPGGSSAFWRRIMSFETRTDRRLGSVEKEVSAISAGVAEIRTEVGAQKEVLGLLKESHKKVEGRQDTLLIGLLALLFALIVLMIMALRALMRMRGDLSGVESRMHDHPRMRR